MAKKAKTVKKKAKKAKSDTSKTKKTVKKKAKTASKKKSAVKAPKKAVEKTAEELAGVSKEKLDDAIYAVAGEIGIQVMNFLGTKENVSEFTIADKLKVDMQTIRNTLYRLHTHNVATYIRKKDRQKGWYISYWTFNHPRIKDLICNMKKHQLEKLKERLEKEEKNQNTFFICPKACARLDFDQATEFEFKCPECGTLLNQQENSRTIEHLKEKINELEKKIVCECA